jgi:hypothetical protein
MKSRWFSILTIFVGFVLAGCSLENEQKYTYELYSINSSTFSTLMSNNYGDNPLTYAKSQPGTSLIDRGSELTIDDVRQKGVNLGLHEINGIDWDESVSDIKNKGTGILWWGSSSYKLIKFEKG